MKFKQEMKTSEVLFKTIDIIKTQGWMTGPAGWRWEDGSRVCLEGGLLAAMGVSAGNGFEGAEVREFRTCPAYLAVQEYLAIETGWLREPLYIFNDWSNEARVLAALKGAAEAEQKKELRAEKEAAAIKSGFIGDNPQEIEFEPLSEPGVVPVTEPAAPEPVREPVPA